MAYQSVANGRGFSQSSEHGAVGGRRSGFRAVRSDGESRVIGRERGYTHSTPKVRSIFAGGIEDGAVHIYLTDECRVNSGLWRIRYYERCDLFVGYEAIRAGKALAV